MKKDINISKSDLKFLLKPLGVFVLVVVVLTSILYFGIGQVRSVNSKLKKAKKLQTTLSQNVNTLRVVDSEISQKQSFIEVALPDSFSSIYYVSQVKILAEEMGLFLTNLRTGINVESDNGLSKSSVSFDVEGSNELIASYIERLTKTLPLGNINKVKTVVSGTLARSSLTVDVFSSSLPEKIPSIDTPVVSLSEDEKGLLQDLVSYTLPNFVKPAPTGPTNREDPFQ